MVSLKAHYDGRTIVPEEPVRLVAGQKLIVHVELADTSSAEQASVLDWAIDSAVEDRSLPADLSHQHDHYLYGTPKQY